MWLRRLLHSRKAQSTVEYAILLGVIAAALFGMQTYIKRGIMGKLKKATDDVSELSFEPALTTVTKHVEYKDKEVKTTIDETGTKTTEVVAGGGTEIIEDITVTPWEEAE